MPNIRGTVVHQRTGRPIEGALVYATQPDVVAVGGPTVETGIDGAFNLPVLQPGTYTVVAQYSVEARPKSRYAFSGSVGPITVGDEDIVTVIHVTFRGVLVGNVFNASTGAAVRGSVVGFLEDTGGQIMSASLEDGWYSLSTINPGSYEVYCEAEGYHRFVQRVFVKDAMQGVTYLPIYVVPLPSLSLPETGVVRGLVLNDAGNPAVGAEVVLTGHKFQHSFIVTADYFDPQFGHYEFRDVPEGQYHVRATKPGMEMAEAEIAVERGKANWAPDLRLRSLPYDRPPEIESLDIEPRSATAGQAIRISVRLAERFRETGVVSGYIVGPGGFSVGFSFDERERSGALVKLFNNWQAPGVFALRQLLVQDPETGKLFEVPLNARFEVAPREPSPLSPDSALFNVPR
jgi:hypothetical protein